MRLREILLEKKQPYCYFNNKWSRYDKIKSNEIDEILSISKVSGIFDEFIFEGTFRPVRFKVQCEVPILTTPSILQKH